MKLPFFNVAKPVWPEGKSEVWNQMVGFYTSWTIDGDIQETTLRIAAGDCYRIWCNGNHAGYGPARTAHGHARVDEWTLTKHLVSGENHLAIEVLWHGVDSYAFALQPPFLQAELVSNDSIVAATPDGFSACVLPERVQKVERFSKQRPFAEAYRLREGCYDWREGMGTNETVPCAVSDQLELLPHHVHLPHFECLMPVGVVEQGTVKPKTPAAPPYRARWRDNVGQLVRGFAVDELEIDISEALNQLEFVGSRTEPESWRSRDVEAMTYITTDFGRVQGGFVGAALRCDTSTRVYLMFDEVQEREAGSIFTLGVGAIALTLSAGVHTVESMDPYTFRYLRVVTIDAPVTVDDLWVRDYANPAADAAECPSDDTELVAIFDAAKQTFRTNAIDLFTDCMSRERGGYPCDSWFTARAEQILTGESRVERNFLENYFLIDEFSSIPKGMFPHCYPSDRLKAGQYIPNWGMWLVMQLADYCLRTDDQPLRDLAAPKVAAMVEFFKPYINTQGLLEDLPGWVFVEWSKANDATRGINYPSNMLYSKCLEMAGTLYGQSDWIDQAQVMRQAILENAWDGKAFADQSLRVNGELQHSDIRTETCQYHAFYFGIADRQSHGALWERMKTDWGPVRALENTDGDRGEGEFSPANMLYGYMLRFDLLQAYEEWDLLLEDVRRTFGPQAELTGTLWENFSPHASCNHGFASCVCEYIWNACGSPI